MPGSKAQQSRPNQFSRERFRTRTHNAASQYPKTSRFQKFTIQPDLKTSAVTTYLENHPQLLDEIILGLCESKIEFLLHIKEKRTTLLKAKNAGSGTKQQKNMYFNENQPRVLSIKLQSEIFIKESRERIVHKTLYDAGNVLATALQVNWFTLYLPCNNNKNLTEYGSESEKSKCCVIGKGTTVSAEAAFLGKTILVEDLPRNSKYPGGIGHPTRDVYSVFSIPLVLPSGDLIAVIELSRNRLKKPFCKRDLYITNFLFGWLSCSLHQANKRRILYLQSQLNNILWDITKEEVLDIESIDHIVEKILFFSKDLVNADRFAMFLVNEEGNQFLADYFFDSMQEKTKHVISSKKHVRFSSDQGIAGYVFKTGETVNVFDAHADECFNPLVDEIVGYHTKSILCMPIVTRGSVIGVIEMVNCLSNDHFTYADVDAFKTFSVYCALALHMSRICDKMRYAQAMYRSTMEVLQYHIIPPPSKSLHLEEETSTSTIPYSFFLYDFNAYTHETLLPQLFIYLIHDLFGKDTFHFKKMCRFILTVKNNYRQLPYHNWQHGFQVAHTLYRIVKTNRDIFTTLETMALIIAGVCHDLDHRGYNNIFYKEFSLPLADLYNTSVMEHHHYKHTVTILQLEGHDIFSFLYSYEYRDMLLMIYDAIIATDLALYMDTQIEVSSMIQDKTFDMENVHCRTLFKSLLMAGADLCGVAKPWDTQLDMVGRLYKEFYLQGDIEKKHGLVPSEMMDRDLRDNIPKQQVGFIMLICKPLFSIIAEVFPGSVPLLKGIETNLCKWRAIASNEEEDKNFFENITELE